MSDIIKEWKEKQVQDGLRSPEVHTCVDRPNLPCLACKTACCDDAGERSTIS